MRLFMALIAFFSVVYLLTCPVDVVAVEGSTTIPSDMPVPNGQRYVLRYIHSVQLTPVEDEIVVTGGAIWMWEERVKSHNAGLPTAAPRNGAFIIDPVWMRVRGGRLKWDVLYVRVGNSALGKNVIYMKPGGVTELYRVCPGVRLALSAKREPLVLWLLAM